MEEFPKLHLTSPPSSLSDGLLAPRVSTPPIPRPRKTSSLSLVSTPKHPASTRHSPLTPHTNGLECHHNKNSFGLHGMHRAPSLDSATHRDIPLSPIMQLHCSHSDSETEEENSSHLQHRSSRPSPGHHPSRHHRRLPQQQQQQHQHSHSLPATPRVNGSSNHSGLNGSLFGTSPSYSAIPCILAAQAADQGSNIVSPSTSHYITCSTGESQLENSAFLNSQDSKLAGVIDYSSLPLPEGNQEPIRRNRDISRHMSEPCMTEAQSCSGGLFYSPRRKGTRCRSKGGSLVGAKESIVMDNIKESGQSEGETEESSALEVQWRFIQTLVSELNVTKASNRKLMADLHQAKMEMQVLKASLDSYTEGGLQPGTITEMVGQIHAAQKVRDEAMMSRIKLANEERDAALTHSRALMEKLSLSPQNTSAASCTAVEASDLQEYPSGGNSSCTSSPRRSDRRLRKSSDLMPTLMSSGNPHTSSPPSFTQGPEQRSVGEREAATLAQLATLEEELRTLRLATATHHHHHHQQHEGGEGGTHVIHGISSVSNEYVEGLCSQLRESETSRWQLHDQCARLERLVGVLRKKLNGLNVVESSMMQEGTKLTLVDLSLRTPATEGTSDSGNLNTQPSTSSEGEPKDSLSSLESVETASASSWKRGEVTNTTSGHSTTNMHSNYVMLHASSANPPHGIHANFMYSSVAPPSPHQSPTVNAAFSTTPSSLCPTTSSSPSSVSPNHHHHCHHQQQQQQLSSQQQGTGLRNDHKHITGVTIVGPITEL